MNEREVRMRAIEALSTMGVRETQRLIRDAKEVVDWVMDGADEVAEKPTPRQPRRSGDKGGEDSPS